MSGEQLQLVPVRVPTGSVKVPFIVGKERAITLGRDPRNDLVVPDAEVSKRHAEIRFRDGAFMVIDLNSSNGTFVNGRRRGACSVKPGDLLEIGQSAFEVAARVVKSEVGQVSIVNDCQTQVLMASPLEELMATGAVGATGVEKRLFERLQIAFDALRSLIQITDLRKLSAKILDVTFELLSTDVGAVFLYTHGGSELEECATRVRPGIEQVDVNLSRTILDQAINEKAGVLASDALTDERFSEAKSIVMSGVRSVMCVPLFCQDTCYGALYVSHYAKVGAFSSSDLDLFTAIGAGAGVAVSNAFLARDLAEEARTRQSLGRFLSPVLVEQVMSERVNLELGGLEQEVTVLFADIRGFTALTERSRAQDIVTLLNDYFEPMVDVIFKHSGILDKFIGDAIMALWGPPESQHHDAGRALAAAQEMQSRLAQHNEARRLEGEEPIHIGIGLASGVCVAGNIGARRRMEYTVIGDAVNLASRLSSVAGPGEVVCDRQTFSRAGSPANFSPRPPEVVKGKTAPVDTFVAVCSNPALDSTH